jgi:hypothetical protein
VLLADNWIPETRNRLAQRRAKKPDTKSGQIWALWPEIKAALADGQSFRSVCEWLTEDAGITVSIPGLRSYVSRSRRKEAVLRKAEAENAFLRAAISGEPQASTGGEPAISKSSIGTPPSKPLEETAQPTDDPMAGAIRALDKARRRDIRDIHGDGDPSGKNLI